MWFGRFGTLQRAGVALCLMKDRAVIAPLRAIYKDPRLPLDNRRVALYALAQRRDPDAVLAVLDAINCGDNGKFQLSAIELLGEMRDSRAAEPLTKLLHESKDADVQKAVNEALSLIRECDPGK
jgi:HEAT repeat protein